MYNLHKKRHHALCTVPLLLSIISNQLAEIYNDEQSYQWQYIIPPTLMISV